MLSVVSVFVKYPVRKLAHAINRDFFSFKIENFQFKVFDIFLIFAQNIGCGSNEYPQPVLEQK